MKILSLNREAAKKSFSTNGRSINMGKEGGEGRAFFKHFSKIKKKVPIAIKLEREV